MTVDAFTEDSDMAAHCITQQSIYFRINFHVPVVFNIVYLLKQIPNAVDLDTADT